MAKRMHPKPKKATLNTRGWSVSQPPKPPVVGEVITVAGRKFRVTSLDPLPDGDVVMNIEPVYG